MSRVTLGALLGGGGFAVVYAGMYAPLVGSKPREVAVKMLVDPTDDVISDFMRELHALSQLQHPCIVELVGACVIPPKRCIVTEMCDGSLFDLLQGTMASDSEPKTRQMHPNFTGLLDIDRRVKLAVDLCEAVKYLHLKKPVALVHRDIKSQNLLLGRDGKLKLCDFGLVGAKVTSAGTPAYMAPELLRDSPFNKSVDVYAVGTVLCELFTNTIPFAGFKPIDIRDAVLAGARPDLTRTLPGTPDVVIECIRQCWDASPVKRPDIATVLDKLQSWKPSALQQLQRSSAAYPGGIAAGPGSGLQAGSRGPSRPSSAAFGGGDALDALASRTTSSRPASKPQSVRYT
jgi:serine/threonine protein kinase